MMVRQPSFDFSEWMPLKEAYSHVAEVLRSAEAASASLRSSLDMANTCALCEEIVCTRATLPPESFGWHFVLQTFWPTATINWNASCAQVECASMIVFAMDWDGHLAIAENATLSACRLWLPRDDVYEFWAPSKSSIRQNKWNLPRLRQLATEIADGKLTTDQVCERLNKKIAPQQIGIGKFRQLIWPRVPEAQKLKGGDNAKTLAAKARRDAGRSNNI